MALHVKSHLRARLVALFGGFFGGFAVFAFLAFGPTPANFGLLAFLFFGLLFGGAYLAQLAFSLAVPAVCPACGATSAIPTLHLPLLYVCRGCGAETKALEAMLAEHRASRPTPAQQRRTRSEMGWVFLAAGAGCIGVAIWLADDSIRLMREGISTEAKVTRVTRRDTRDNEGKYETTYTAFIEYKVGQRPIMLKRSWSVGRGSFCVWPCYAAGEQLKVVYRPADPTQAKVSSLAEFFFVPVLLGVIGAPFSAFGFFMLRHRRSKPPGAQESL